MDLVHDDEPEIEQRAGAGVEHVAQDLGGHDDDGRLAIDGVVAGEEPDVARAVAIDEVGELLVGQRLDRRRVEALAAGGQRDVDSELADQRLAGPCGRGDEHAVTGLDRFTCVHLEWVEREVVQLPKIDEVVHAVLAIMVSARGTTSAVSGSGPRRSPSPYATMPSAAHVMRLARMRSTSGWLICVPR